MPKARRRYGRLSAVSTVLLLASGCVNLNVDAKRTNPNIAAPYEGPVTVVVLQEPPGAVEVGTLEVQTGRGPNDLQKIVDKLSEDTRAMGGNVLKIDSIEETANLSTPVGESGSMPTGSYSFQIKARALLLAGGGK